MDKSSKRLIAISYKRNYSKHARSFVNKNLNKNHLKKQIHLKELQIKKLHLHQSSSDVCNQLYNTLILEKAILKKELENLEKNPLVEKVKKMFSRKEKLICDYFKN